MSIVKVRRPHALSKSRVLEILDGLARDPAAADISYRWENDSQQRLFLKGERGLTKGCTGQLDVGSDFVEVTLKLSGLASMASGLVKSELTKHLDRLLATA